MELNILKKSENKNYLEKFKLCGHDPSEIKKAVSDNKKLKIDFITTEPIVKKGSFICCCKKL